MAITFVAAGAVSVSANAITPALPAGIQTDDILVLFGRTINGEAMTIADAAGGTWEELDNSPQDNATDGVRGTWFWSRYNGTQTAPTTNDSGGINLARIAAWRDCIATGDPIDATAGGAQTAATSMSNPGLTTTVPECMVVVSSILDRDQNSSANATSWANASLASITEVVDEIVGLGSGGGHAIANGIKTAAGTVDATTWTQAASGGTADLTFALKPLTSTQNLAGVLFEKAPTFFGGTVENDAGQQDLTGSLFQRAPTFFTGRIARAVPAGLTTDEILVIGHSNVATFIAWYRSLSTVDLLPPINQGGATVKVWGDPLDGGHESAWDSLPDDEPVGGYRAAWLMLGFLASFTESEAQMQAWIDVIIDRLHTDFPGLEYVWYSPMNTYFSSNPGDGDAEDLLTFDPWDTNPFSLTTWKGSDQESEWSWDMTLYAQSQGYFDDFGPWINLTDAQTDTDDRHPTEGASSGQSHGGEILLAFFEGGAQGLLGNLFTKAPTFFAGTVTTGSVALTGSLFANAPTFFTGAVTTGPVNLTGALFQKAPSFFAGSVASSYALGGSLFTKAPTFNAGAITVGSVALSGVLFSKAPTFFTGVATAAGDVAFDAVSESHTGTTGSVSEASFSWSHNPVGTPRGVLVFTFVNDAIADDALAVTYGGAALSPVPGGRALDTVTETGDVKAWFLGTSVPTADPATVVVTRTNNTNVMYAVAITVTATDDTAVHLPGIVLLQENQALAEQSVTDGSPGANSLRFAALNSGFGAEASVPPGANSTALVGIDFGARVINTVRETTAGQGARSVGFVQAVGDDVAAVHLAVRKVAAAQTLNGSLFVKAPTFPQGVISPGVVSLAGQLFQKVPTFFTGEVTAGAVNLTGTLFQQAPTFFTGTVNAGAVNLAGVLFQNTPVFFAGQIVTAGVLTGVLFQNTPVFFVGTVTQPDEPSTEWPVSTPSDWPSSSTSDSWPVSTVPEWQGV